MGLRITFEDIEEFMKSYRDRFLPQNRGKYFPSLGEHFCEYFSVKNKRLAKIQDPEKAMTHILNKYLV